MAIILYPEDSLVLSEWNDILIWFVSDVHRSSLSFSFQLPQTTVGLESSVTGNCDIDTLSYSHLHQRTHTRYAKNQQAFYMG